VDLLTISQIAAPILQTIFIAVIGLGYYFTVGATWATVKEMRAEHAAGGGRPLITVSEDYANLPNISLIVQNVGQGPAKDISFGFSDRVESSDGFVLSELPFFAEWLTSLAPGAKIGCYWDTLDNLLPLIKEGKIGLGHHGDGALQGPQPQPPGARVGDQPPALRGHKERGLLRHDRPGGGDRQEDRRRRDRDLLPLVGQQRTRRSAHQQTNSLERTPFARSSQKYRFHALE
jgi:hypothetical protein